MYVKLSPVNSFTKKEIEKWSSNNLDSSCYVISDGLHCFEAFSKATKKHIPIIMKKDPKTGKKPYFKWVNTILGNVKNSLTGTYRSSKDVYATRYLAEFQYRINRRFDLTKILIRLMYAAGQTPPLPGGLLRKAANST